MQALFFAGEFRAPADGFGFGILQDLQRFVASFNLGEAGLLHSLIECVIGAALQFAPEAVVHRARDEINDHAQDNDVR